MSRNFAEFDKKECKKILSTFLKDTCHTHKKKTILFLIELRKISKEDIDSVLILSEKYYFYLREYFTLDEEGKLFFAAKKIKEYEASDLNCCLELLEQDSIGKKLMHMLSVEHFLYKENVALSLHKDIEFIIEYFKKTGNANKNEIGALHRLLQENKDFLALVIQEKNKV